MIQSFVSFNFTTRTQMYQATFGSSTGVMLGVSVWVIIDAFKIQPKQPSLLE